MTCTVRPNFGVLNFNLGIFGQMGSSVQTLQIAAPTVTSATTSDGSLLVLGNSILTINGASFGNNASLVSVTVGIAACANPTITIAHVQITCTSPGVGAQKGIQSTSYSNQQMLPSLPAGTGLNIPVSVPMEFSHIFVHDLFSSLVLTFHLLLHL